MNRTLFALWAIIFGSVLAVLALLVVLMQQREAQARLDLATLLSAQLTGYNRDLRQLFEQYDRQLQQALDGFDPQLPGAVLTLERNPLCDLAVVVGDDGFKGRLWHPDPQRVEIVDRSLVEDAVTWIRDSNFTHRSSVSNANSQTFQNVSSGDARLQIQAQGALLPLPTAPSSPDVDLSQRASRDSNQRLGNNASSRLTNAFLGGESHWTTWYHGRGLVLGYWTKSLHETVTMVIVPRGRWLSDLVATLPDNAEARADALVQLVDVEGATISQWGNLELMGRNDFDAEIPVDDPLGGWRLRLILTPSARAAALGLGNRWMIALGAVGISSTIVLLGLLITVNFRRQMRMAQQQVSFVNQVSHELRTPLTNIRMYTDLALQGLETHRELGLDSELDRLVVIQQETTRLGRLIENVLAFARSGKPRPLRRTTVNSIEVLIDNVLATFEPQLVECKIDVQREFGGVPPLSIDREAVEQILVNLISNAIKYAAVGRLIRIETAYANEQLRLLVADNGPGISRRLRRSVFKPFVRGSNRLEDPAGTGIGLSIARQLARQHGGDCRLLPSSLGCIFEVHVHATVAEDRTDAADGT